VSDISLHTRRLDLTPLAREHAAFHDASECTTSETHWREHGFGHWAVVDREDGSFVGVAEVHFAYPGVEGISTAEVEVGWSVSAERQGEGIATEAMQAAIDDAWERTGADHLVAYIRPENAPSLRVATKLGFALRGPGRATSGDPVEVYEVRRDG
jgi:RimJ/RimL family protein N-acetyltransferase